MSVSCQTAYQVVVSGTPPTVDAYWTLNESGVAVPRVDKVAALALTPNAGAIMDAQPGLISNGLAFAEKGNGITSNFSTINTTQLGIQSANGWSWAFWFKVLHWPAAGTWNQAPQMIWGALAATFRITVIWDPADNSLFCQDGTIPNCFFVQFSDNNGNLYSTNFVPVVGPWNFAHVFFDPAGPQLGMQINNGSRHLVTQCVGAPATPVFSGPAVLSNLIASQQWGQPDTANIPVIIDEMLFKLSRILNASELTYLYNGGLGHTWPLT